MSPRPDRARSVLPSACALAASTAVFACAGPKNFDNENDRLRRELADARAEIDRLTESERRLAAALEAERNATERRAPSAQALALLPKAERLSLGRLSGPVPGGGAVDLYISPLDDRARFVQVAGTLTVRLDLLPPPESGSASEPRLLATLELGPTELREAYRSSLTGTHYSVRVPIVPPLGPQEGSLGCSVRLDDLVTGERLEATAVWPIPAR